MLFAQDGNIEKALKNSIETSVKERIASTCETWDLASVLAHAWGVKEMVDPSQAAEIKKYMESAAGSTIALEDNRAATLLKGDVKEKGTEALLIYRYQLIG